MTNLAMDLRLKELRSRLETEEMHRLFHSRIHSIPFLLDSIAFLLDMVEQQSARIQQLEWDANRDGDFWD